MALTNIDPTIILDTHGFYGVWAVAIQPDGAHVLGGTDDGIRRWRRDNGQEVGKHTGMDLDAIAVSRNDKWIVCGTQEGASIWDREMQEKVIVVEETKKVFAVDISPDSTKLAVGTGDRDNNKASIWSIASGKRLVGPLEHEEMVVGIRFSPEGVRVATATIGGPIRIFDSRNGDQLIVIETTLPTAIPATPIAWSSDGRRIFSTSGDEKVKSFDVSTGSILAESSIPGDHNVNLIRSIAPAPNGKFIVSHASHLIWFLDTSSLTQIGPVIEDIPDLDKEIWSISISTDSGYLATGRRDGKVVVHDISNILPDMYGPFHASAPKERQQYEQLSTPGGYDNKLPESNPKNPEKSNALQSGSEDGGDLLEHEALSNAPEHHFDYSEPPSATTNSHPWEGEITTSDPSDAASRTLDVQPAIPILPLLEARPPENLDAAEATQDRSLFTKWLRRKNGKQAASREPKRHPGKSHLPDSPRSPSDSSAKVDTPNKGPSWMVAGQRQRRAVAKPVVQQQPKSNPKSAVRKHVKKDTPRSEQHAVDPWGADSDVLRRLNDPPQPSAAGVHITEGSKYATLSVTFPKWMLCFRSGTHDEAH